MHILCIASAKACCVGVLFVCVITFVPEIIWRITFSQPLWIMVVFVVVVVVVVVVVLFLI